MNVKISEGSVTFKISEEELRTLLSGKALEKKMMLGKGSFVIVIDSEPEPFFDDAIEHPLKLIQDRFETCIMFCTSKEILQKLFDMGKSRDGLGYPFDQFVARIGGSLLLINSGLFGAQTWLNGRAAPRLHAG